MLCFGGGDVKKKKARKSLNGLKEYTLTFTANIATYDVYKINQKQLMKWMEDQLNYGMWEMIWDTPTLVITTRKTKRDKDENNQSV